MFNLVPANAVFKAILPSFFFMSSLLDNLLDQDVWLRFLNYKTEKGYLLKKEEKTLSEFIHDEQYRDIARQIVEGGTFGLPEKCFLNKIGSPKKRVVYRFPEEELMILKMLSFLLYKYDGCQSENCYSFRPNRGAQKAIRYLTETVGKRPVWGYKVDIHDYFNSISIQILLPILKNMLSDDERLYSFLERLLTENKAVFENQIIEEERGVMAGTPVSPFLANIYLIELDAYFLANQIIYVRYSDDIILFTDSYEEIENHKKTIFQFLKKYKLTVNPEKEKLIPPDEAWEFLGIQYEKGKIDLSEATKKKVKGKIRRKARSLRRWMLKKDVEPERVMKTIIKIFNRKFFENRSSHELTWSKWFFPIVNQSKGFKEIDNYLQQNIRYIPTGKYSKANYKVKYKDMKALGYRSLVHEFYESLNLYGNENVPIGTKYR